MVRSFSHTSLAHCPEGVLFMFDADDFRLADADLSLNYEILGEVVYKHNEKRVVNGRHIVRTLVFEGREYDVFADRSVKLRG